MTRAGRWDGRELSVDSSPSGAQPFLMELARRQAARRAPADVLARYAEDGFAEPASVDQRTLARLAAAALASAPDHEALQLSPVAPLGACSAVAPVSQDRVLSAQRGTEVVADPTNVLALECASRLRERPDEPVRLCTVHQVLRAQPLPKGAGFSRHFSMFCLADAGRARAEDGFEVDAAAGQLTVLHRLAGEIAPGLPPRRCVVLFAPASRPLADRVAAALAERLPDVAVEPREGVGSYYDGLRVRYEPARAAGEPFPLADLGRFDWVARLTSNRRMRFVASGFGLQLVAALGAVRSPN